VHRGGVGQKDGGVVEELFALRVGAEVDGPRRGDPHQVGAQALEKGPRTLVLHDVPANKHDLVKQ